MFKCVWLGLAVLALAGCAAPVCKPQPIALVKLYFSQNQPMFEGILDGVGVPMLLDTGAEYSVITPATEALVKAPSPFFGGGTTLIGAGGVVHVRNVTVKRFQMGVARGSAFNFKVVKLVTLGAHPSRRIGGVIGDDVFHNYDLDLDFPHRQAFLIDTGSCREVIPWEGVLRPQFTGFGDWPIVFVRIGRHLVQALIDTGTTRTVMSLRTFKQLGLAAEHPVILGHGHAVGVGARQFDVEIVRLPPMIVGGVVWRDPVVAVGGSASLVLGEDFIRQHEIYISYPRHLLWVRAAPVSRPGQVRSAGTAP